jgi:hypothetical protein
MKVSKALLDGRYVCVAPDGPDTRRVRKIGADGFLSSGWSSAGSIRLVQGGR